METQQQNIRNWDDLIFENRNKAYGAYALRQSYSDGLLKGVLTSIGFVVTVLLAAGFVNTSKIIEKVNIVPIFEPGLPPKIKADIIPQQQRTEPVRSINRELPPQVVTTETPVEPIAEPETTTGTEGISDGTTGSDTGTPNNTATTGFENPVEKKTEVFMHAEVMPSYKSGMEGMMKTLRKNMRYPISAKKMGKEGTVFVEFIINDEGDITDVKVLRGFDLACDKEAVRMVERLMDWNPGQQNQVAVNVKLILPIKFKIEQ